MKKKIFFYLVLSILILVPLVFTQEVKAIFTMPKLFVLRIISFISIILLAWNVYKEGVFRYVKTKWNKTMVSYAIISIITTIFSVQIYASFFGVQGRFLGIFTILNFLFLAFMALNSIRTQKQLITLISVSVAVAFFLSLYGIMQKYSAPDSSTFSNFFQKIVGDPASWSQKPTERVFGTIGHSNHYGAYLAFNFMLLLSLIGIAKKWWQKILLSAAGIFFIPAIIATASRGAAFALVIGLIVFGLCLIRYHASYLKSKKFILIGILIIPIIGGIVFREPLWLKFKETKLIKRSIETIEFMKQGNIPDRVSWWLSSLEMLKDRPVLGHGLSTYKDIYNNYRRTDYLVPTGDQDTTTPESAHMEYLTILAEQGIVGFAIYIWMVGFVIFALMKEIWKEGNFRYRMIHIGILSALFTYLAQVLLSFGVISTFTIFYLFLGVGLASVHLSRSSTGSETAPIEEKEIFFRGKKKLLIVATTILLSFTGMYYSWKHVQAEYFFGQAQKNILAGDFQTAWFDYQKTIESMPYEYVYFHDYAKDLFDATSGHIKTVESPVERIDTLETNLTEAIIMYEKARALSPNQPYVHANLGTTYIVMAKDVYEISSRDEEAKKLYEWGILEEKKSIEIGKNNPIYPYNFATLLYTLEKYDEAISYLEMAHRIREPVRNSYYLLASSYSHKGQKEKALEYVKKELERDPQSSEAQELLKQLGTL